MMELHRHMAGHQLIVLGREVPGSSCGGMLLPSLPVQLGIRGWESH